MALPTRKLGKTGVALPVLGFGTAPAGNRLTQREAVHLFEKAFNAGVTYFDTAPEFAGYGKAQRYLAPFLKARRKEIFLVTKCFAPTSDGALKLLESNLKELQTNYADLVFVHSLGADKMDPSIVFSRSGAYAGLVKAKKLGLTKYIGLSGHNRPKRFVEAIQRFEVDVLLNAVNFVDHQTYNFEEVVWPVAHRLNLGLIAMKVYGGKRKTENLGLSHCLMPKAHLDGAFRYAMGLGSTTCAVIGMATSQELQENLQRAKNLSPLSPRERAKLLTVGRSLANEWGPHFGSVV